MDEELDRLQGEVVAARAAYFVVHKELEALVGPLARDPGDACEHLVNVAEEFGAEQAMLDLDRPGNPVGLSVELDDEARAAIAANLDALMEARDRLDLATAAREDLLMARDPRHDRVVHFGGYEYAVDGYYYALRGLEDPREFHPAPELAGAARAEPEPSLTEQIGKDVAKAQPSPERGRERRR